MVKIKKVTKKIKKLKKKAKATEAELKPKIKKKISKLKQKKEEAEPKVSLVLGLLELLLDEAKIALPEFYETMQWSRGRAHYYMQDGIFLPLKHQKELQRKLNLPEEVWERVYKRFSKAIFS